MGNWMRLHLTGTCAESETEALKAALTVNLKGNFDSEAWRRVGPLTISEGLCGLGSWSAAVVSAVGNAFERDYDEESVQAQLEKLVEIAPSLELTVHCGGDYESAKCVATVKVSNGKVELLPPGVETLPEIDEDVMMGRLLKAVKPRRFT